MNMFARFNENPAMTLQDIKETKRYGRTDNVKTVYPLQTKFAGGIIKVLVWSQQISHSKSMQILYDAQGKLTPQSKVGSTLN